TDVVVVGTRFSVDYGDGSGDVDVRVTEGVVRVVHLQQETRVAAGQAWRTRTGLIAMAGGPRAAGAALSGAGGPTTPGADSPAARAPDRAPGGDAGREPGHEPTHAPTWGTDAPGMLHDRRAAVPDAPAPPAPPPPRPAAPAHPAGHEPPHPRPAGHDDPRLDLGAAIRAQHIEPALDLGEPSPAGAITRYYDIAAHRSGDEASQAFYSIAWVRYFRQDNPADALQALDAYVRRFPGGKQYRAALWLRVRIQCLERFDAACHAAAYTYLHEAPDAPAAHVAELLTQAE
ncbi:MAG TPA: hypothetical protein VHW23_02535, partial [Kofleriaceae bacterium]|nr:hypothetical protein [Kofleriaceae bacterium]